MTLLFDFTVDKATSTIHIKREFAADLDLVWDAWTKVEILELWMAPKPWSIKTKEMDFRVGGRWLYTMISPENTGPGFWSLAKFTSIEAKKSFSSENSFCDENGNAVAGFSSSLTTTTFKPVRENTIVHVEKRMASLAELEKFVAMGFKEGMALCLKQLDEVLGAREQEPGTRGQ